VSVRWSTELRLRTLAVAIGLVLAGGTLALLTQAGAEHHGAKRASTLATTKPTVPSSTVPPRPPERVRFARLDRNYVPTGVMTVMPDGTGLEALSNPILHPDTEIWRAGGLATYHVFIASRLQIGTPVCTPYECSPRFGVNSGAIAVADLDGSHERFVTVGPSDAGPTFSQAGDIAFFRAITATLHHLVVIDATGRVLNDFAPGAGEEFDTATPTWSPDGSQVAVPSVKLGGNEDAGGIDIIPLDGRPRRRVVRGVFNNLAWSHDGRSFVATHDRTHDVAGYPPHSAINTTGDDLWLIPLEGSPLQLTHLAPPVSPVIITCPHTPITRIPRLGTPTWSPDDQHITFLNSYPHTEDPTAWVTDVYVIARDGTDSHALYRQPITCPTPGLRGEGRLAIFGWDP
jgi:WD40 repeat protein